MLTKLFTLPYRLVVVGYPPALTVGEYAPDKRALSVAVRRRFALRSCGENGVPNDGYCRDRVDCLALLSLGACFLAMLWRPRRLQE
jgi:hypothetical protein